MSSDPNTNETNGSTHTNNNGVTLPLEEVLRLTTLQDTDSEYQFEEARIQPQRRRSRGNNRASTSRSPGKYRRTSKESDFEREIPNRTKSGSSTSSRGSRKLKQAIKNERKSVDKVVGAAIRKYEAYDQSPNNSLRKTRTAPGRTKSGSSSNGKKKKSGSEGDYSKKKGRKRNLTNETAPQQQTQEEHAHEQSQESHAEVPAEAESRDSSTHSARSAHVDATGAIAVYPSDSNRETTRLDRSNRPNRLSVAGNFLTSSEFNQIDATYQEEEIPVPPESQIIDAVVTVRNPNPRQEGATVSDMDTLTTAPTVASSVVRDSESGTVTATAVSSENYYQQVRRQLQQEAVSAVAVVALPEDESIHNKKKRSKTINDIEKQTINDHKAQKGKGKKFWMCCAITTLAVLCVSIGVGIAVAAIRKRRARNNNNSESLDCEDDMACRMDTMMSTDAGQYWRQRLLELLPRSTLVNILEDANFMSPQYMALDFITSNTESLFGFSLDEMMDMDKIGEFTDVELSRLTTLFALVTLYHSLDGPEWIAQTNWLEPEVDCCDWYGVECHFDSIPTPNRPILQNADNSILADLDDDGSGLQGILVGSFQMDERDGFFADKLKFHSLRLEANNLRGTIPEEISLLSNIYGYIDLSRNNIHGSIPADLSKLSKLQAISLDRNDLSSTVPPEIADMKMLRVFDISHNPTLTGDVSIFEGWNNIGTF